MFTAAVRRCAAAAQRQPIHLLTTPEQCQSMCERILNSGLQSVAVDCEGPKLGRFGRIALVQLATDTEVYLVDVALGGPRVMEPLIPLFGSRELVKVFHDCREDASTLLHRHGAPLAAVFDTQVGHMAWLERKNLEPYQASIAETLRTFQLARYRAHRWDELESRQMAPQRWLQRPLDPQSVRYAVEGVAHLLPLQRAICKELGDPGGDLVLKRGVRYLEYARLNQAELPSADASSLLRPGLPLKAMLATRRPDAAYFKLNHAPLTGAVTDATDLRDFADLAPGDIAACRVKSVSECGQFAHLQREGHGNLFYDRQRGEMRGLPSKEEMNRAHPHRQSTLYGLGRSMGRGGIEQERSSFREQKPEVVYKKGKRGSLKVRDTAFQPPKRQAERGAGSAEHRSFPMGGAR